MTSPSPSRDDAESTPSTFEELAQEKQPSLAAEFLHFLIENKAWWLAPIILVLLLLSVLILWMGTGAAPFIYTVF